MMATETATVEALARRLDGLERQNRRLTHGVIAMTIVALAGATAQGRHSTGSVPPIVLVVQAFRPAVICAGAHARPVDPANTQLGVAKHVAGNIAYCLGLRPKSASREVAGGAFCPLTRVTPPAN